MNILLFGPPGSGKGTQSALLVSKFGMTHLSTGDLFRAAIKNGTALGNEAKKYMDQGQLVPDSVTIGLVEEKLSLLAKKAFILDGFPRNVAQADVLESLLKKMNLPLGKALFLHVPFENLFSRLTGRRVCESCGATFHVDTMPTQKEGICDVCGGKVVQRKDDMPDVIKTRLEAYEKNTAPLKEYYKSKGTLEVINGLGEVDDVFLRITKAMGKSTF